MVHYFNKAALRLSKSVPLCTRVWFMGRDGKRKPDRDSGTAAKRTKYFSSVRLLARVLFTINVAEHGAATAFALGAQNQNAALPKNTRGFLISCISYKERLAAQEAINLLTEVRGWLVCKLLTKLL